MEHRIWDTKSSRNNGVFQVYDGCQISGGDQNLSRTVAAIINHFPEVPGSAVTYKCSGSPVVVESKKDKKKSAFRK